MPMPVLPLAGALPRHRTHLLPRHGETLEPHQTLPQAPRPMRRMRSLDHLLPMPMPARWELDHQTQARMEVLSNQTQWAEEEVEAPLVGPELPPERTPRAATASGRACPMPLHPSRIRLRLRARPGLPPLVRDCPPIMTAATAMEVQEPSVVPPRPPTPIPTGATQELLPQPPRPNFTRRLPSNWNNSTP